MQVPTLAFFIVWRITFLTSFGHRHHHHNRLFALRSLLASNEMNSVDNFIAQAGWFAGPNIHPVLANNLAVPHEQHETITIIIISVIITLMVVEQKKIQIQRMPVHWSSILVSLGCGIACWCCKPAFLCTTCYAMPVWLH